MASSMVTLYFSTSAPITRESRGFGWKITPIPVAAGRQSVPVNPNEWKKGNIPMMRSSECKKKSWLSCSTFEAML